MGSKILKWRAIAAVAAILLCVPLSFGFAQGKCGSSKSCCATACSGNTEFPTSEACLADACACAQQLHCIIQEQQQGWNLFPGSTTMMPVKRPAHGRYLTIRVNPVAEGGLESFGPGKPGPVDMPAGSAIAKWNFNADPANPGHPNPNIDDGSITSMFKFDSYCPKTVGGAKQCAGGNWYFLFSSGDELFGGKSGGCISCHAPAENADWMWRLFTARRFAGGDTEAGGN